LKDYKEAKNNHTSLYQHPYFLPLKAVQKGNINAAIKIKKVPTYKLGLFRLAFIQILDIIKYVSILAYTFFICLFLKGEQ